MACGHALLWQLLCAHKLLAVQATLKQLLQHLAQQPESHLGGRTALLQLGQDLALVKGNQILRSWTVPSPSPFSTAQLLQTGADAPSGAKVQSSECSLQRPSVKRQPVTGSSDAEVHSSADKLRAAEQQQQPGLMPLILDVQPATVTCEPGSSGGPWVQLTGLGLCCEDCQIVCRAGGQHLLVSPEMHAACCTSGSVDSVRAAQPVCICKITAAALGTQASSPLCWCNLLCCCARACRRAWSHICIADKDRCGSMLPCISLELVLSSQHAMPHVL